MSVPNTRTDTGLLAWASAASAQISASPSSFGVPVPTATDLAAKVTAYSDALAVATDGTTRSPSSIAAKNTARGSLRKAISDVVKLVYGTPTVTDEQLRGLGLKIPASHRTPVPPPGMAPKMTVKSVVDRTVTYELADASVEGARRKPANAIGALILSYYGENPPPEGSADWKVEGQTGKNLAIVQFSQDVTPGTKCWATSMWYSRRGAYSPACQPVMTYLQIGPAAQQA